MLRAILLANVFPVSTPRCYPPWIGYSHIVASGVGVFCNDYPIITWRLGCGRGEYTVELARLHPENSISVLISKGIGCGAELLRLIVRV